MGRHVGWPVSVGGFALISTFVHTYPLLARQDDIISIFSVNINANGVSVSPLSTWACSDSLFYSAVVVLPHRLPPREGS